MIPDAAVEAASRTIEACLDLGVPLGEMGRTALEAAAPHMLSHEREETRLAHLDAVVNRETKRAELAAAWDEGHERGFWNGRLSQLTVPYDAPKPDVGKADADAANPYRPAT